MKELKSAITELHIQNDNFQSSNFASTSNKNNTLEESRKEIIKNTDPAVLNEYNELLKLDFDIVEDDININQPEINSSKIFDLTNSGGKIEITVTHEEVNNVEDSGAITLAYVQKPFGSYNYRVQYRIYHVLYPDAWAVLNTYYKTASNGLTATSSSIAGTGGIFPAQVSGSSRVTDSRAEQLGYDINAQGDYTVTYIGANGIGLLHFNITLISTIKWEAQGSTSSYVSESYTKY